MQNSIFITCLIFLILLISCNKETTSPTLVADLTDAQVADIVKMNFNEEFGGTEAIRKFYFEYFKESELKYDTIFEQNILLASDKFSISGIMDIKYRFFQNMGAGIWLYPYVHTFNNKQKFLFTSTLDNFEINGQADEGTAISYDKDKLNCVITSNSFRKLDIINKKINLNAKASIRINLEGMNCDVTTLKFLKNPDWDVSLKLDDITISSSSKEITAKIELNEFFNPVLILPNGKKFVF